MSTKQRAICILGMHRSGTSAVSRSLNLMGVHLGNNQKLIKPASSNPKGFWEHQDITTVQQQILQTLSRSWDTAAPLPKRWWKYEKIKPYKDQLIQIVREDFSEFQLWGWKDPRTCLTFPVWKEIFRELNMDVSCVIVVRNPLDVAASLYRRNRFEFGKSLNIWTLFTLSSLIHSEGMDRDIILYDELLKQPVVELKELSEQLDIRWPRDEQKFKKQLNSFLEPGLQHSKSGVKQLLANPHVPNYVSLTYSSVLQADRSKDFLESERFHQQIRELYNKYSNRRYS